ncbi:hypothetical protein E2C01_031100 [Portunus trituberculatus]|uniref:Uncharacterized protein n=1 Tax=Portunus trituberculatus TaxID=210409 RepID=A0A5B7EXP4_PORTR|nr:hypothetical protein [Portunus trituberculatus]
MANSRGHRDDWPSPPIFPEATEMTGLHHHYFQTYRDDWPVTPQRSERIGEKKDKCLETSLLNEVKSEKSDIQKQVVSCRGVEYVSDYFRMDIIEYS